MIAQAAGSVIYKALEAGNALVLIDGWDELSTDERDGCFYWLRALREVYGRNPMVIAGPATGYAPLETLGFTPTFLRPWQDGDFSALVERWSKVQRF